MLGKNFAMTKTERHEFTAISCKAPVKICLCHFPEKNTVNFHKFEAYLKVLFGGGEGDLELFEL